MNFGIIGCGGIADRRTIPGMIKSNKVKIVAVEDISEDLSKKVVQKYGVSSFYTEEDELLKNDEVSRLSHKGERDDR